MPLDETADVDRDVALALLERGRDLVERERPLVEVEEPEDAAAERRQDARCRGRRADPIDEDAGRPIHGHSSSCLAYSECSVNTLPVAARVGHRPCRTRICPQDRMLSQRISSG